MKQLALIVAMNDARVIGNNGDLPWRIREDLRHFKRTTMGHAIIMGRTTWDSIGRPLPGRQNIVITRNQSLQIEGCAVVHSLEAAIDLARESGDECPMIIGGATIYEIALPLTTLIHLTRVERDVEGDTFFPELSLDEWEEESSVAGNTPGVTFCVLRRKTPHDVTS